MMRETDHSAKRISLQGEPGSTIGLLQKQYPGLVLSVRHERGKGWTLRAKGPEGALVMRMPAVLRGETITAACMLVCRSNVALRGTQEPKTALRRAMEGAA